MFKNNFLDFQGIFYFSKVLSDKPYTLSNIVYRMIRKEDDNIKKWLKLVSLTYSLQVSHGSKLFFVNSQTDCVKWNYVATKKIMYV